MNTNILTVSEAVAEHALNNRTLQRWIQKGLVQAEKVGDAYQIDRVSLAKHLATTRGPKIDPADKAESTSEVTAIMQQDGGIIAPCSREVKIPGGGGTGAEATATPPTPALDMLAHRPETSASDSQETKEPRPSPSPVPTRLPVDERAGAGQQKRSGPQSASKPPGSAVKGQRAQSRAPERKVPGRNAQRGPKKFKKGPVRYAKDVMRKFDVAQMRNVRDWLMQRLDAK